MASAAEIIYVGNFRFPEGDAGSARVRGMGMALRDAGYSVAVAGLEDRAFPQDIQSDGRACREGLYYYPAKNFGSTKTARIRRGIYHYATASATMDRLPAIVSNATRAIIVYDGGTPLILRLLKFCRQRNIALIADCTEWYDPRHVPGGRFGPWRWDSESRMRWLLPKIGSVIAISSYLERYYRERGCEVLRVPPLVDLRAPCWKPISPVVREDSEIHLMYAGTPYKKDLLAEALRAIIRLRSEGLPVKIHLVGATREGLGKWMTEDASFVDDLGDAAVCYGRLPQLQVLEKLTTADFTILLREDKRYAHAGFPTKLVESLAAGVPIITNATSDIAEYVRDGCEGILLENHSPEAFAAAVRRLLQMKQSAWHEMRLNARRRAEQCFDYRGYIAALKEFIECQCARNAARRRHG
jgi:glycosyltransferase involved in cell wall biosynthesis